MFKLIRMLVGTLLSFRVKASLLVSEPYMRKHVLESCLIAFIHLLMLINPVFGLVFHVTFEFFHGIFHNFPLKRPAGCGL